MLKLQTLEYIAGCLKFSAVPMTIFELLPAVRRISIESHIQNTLTCNLIVRLIFITITSYILLVIFPYISPYLAAISMASIYVAVKLISTIAYITNSNEKEEYIFNLLFLITFVVILCLSVNIETDLPKKTFLLSFLQLIFAIIICILLPNNIRSSLFFFINLVFFWVFTLPLGIGYFFGADKISLIFTLYERVAQSVNKTFPFHIIPNFTGEKFSETYQASTAIFKNLLPDFFVSWTPFKMYFLSADGYLIICGLLTQIFLVFSFFILIKTIVYSIIYIFIYTAKFIKIRFHIEERSLIPLGGIILIIIGETIEFTVKTINQFIF